MSLSQHQSAPRDNRGLALVHHILNPLKDLPSKFIPPFALTARPEAYQGIFTNLLHVYGKNKITTTEICAAIELNHGFASIAIQNKDLEVLENLVTWGVTSLCPELMIALCKKEDPAPLVNAYIDSADNKKCMLAIDYISQEAPYAIASKEIGQVAPLAEALAQFSQMSETNIAALAGTALNDMLMVWAMSENNSLSIAERLIECGASLAYGREVQAAPEHLVPSGKIATWTLKYIAEKNSTHLSLLVDTYRRKKVKESNALNASLCGAAIAAIEESDELAATKLVTLLPDSDPSENTAEFSPTSVMISLLRPFKRSKELKESVVLLIDILHTKGAHVCLVKGNSSALHLANAAVISKMLTSMVQPFDLTLCLNSKKCTPLHAAAEENNAEVMTALIEFMRSNFPDRLKEFLNAIGNPSAPETALFSAVRKGHLDATRILVAAGANLFLKGNEGENALHAAARSSENDARSIAEFLIKEDSTLVSQQDSRRSRTPLHEAASSINNGVLACILEKMHENVSALTALDSTGMPPLYDAINWFHDNPRLQAQETNTFIALIKASGMAPSLSIPKKLYSRMYRIISCLNPPATDLEDFYEGSRILDAMKLLFTKNQSVMNIISQIEPNLAKKPAKAPTPVQLHGLAKVRAERAAAAAVTIQTTQSATSVDVSASPKTVPAPVTSPPAPAAAAAATEAAAEIEKKEAPPEPVPTSAPLLEARAAQDTVALTSPNAATETRHSESQPLYAIVGAYVLKGALFLAYGLAAFLDALSEKIKASDWLKNSRAQMFVSETLSPSSSDAAQGNGAPPPPWSADTSSLQASSPLLVPASADLRPRSPSSGRSSRLGRG